MSDPVMWWCGLLLIVCGVGTAGIIRARPWETEDDLKRVIMFALLIFAFGIFLIGRSHL